MLTFSEEPDDNELNFRCDVQFSSLRNEFQGELPFAA
jgi:hypothetical protein